MLYCFDGLLIAITFLFHFVRSRLIKENLRSMFTGVAGTQLYRHKRSLYYENDFLLGTSTYFDVYSI